MVLPRVISGYMVFLHMGSVLISCMLKLEGLAEPEPRFAGPGRVSPVCHMKVGPH